MSTPVGERPEPTYSHPSFSISNASQDQERPSFEHPSLPSYNVNNQQRNASHDKSSDEEGTVVGDFENIPINSEHDKPINAPNQKENFPPITARLRANSHLTVQTATDYEPGDPLRSIGSPSQTREQAHRLDDDLALLKIERQVSRQAEEEAMSRTRSQDEDMYRSKSRRREDHVDEFDVATNPVHEKTQVYKPVEHPSTGFAKFVKQLHATNWLVRYVVYISPLTLILLIPLLLGSLVFKQATVGGVYLQWFMIWLEIVWLSLWAGRILAKCLPWPIGVCTSLFTNNSKKWRDMGKELELPATLFFWWLAIEVSFLPTMLHHQKKWPASHTASWMVTMNKVLVSLFVAAILNFCEKIIIQLIAISFHLRTYADRIELNKFQIGSLAKLYKFSKEKIAMEDYEFEAPSVGPASGARTPGALISSTAKTTKQAFTKFGDIAGRVAGDFTGKQTKKSSHPHQVVLALIASTTGAQVLARRLYRTFAREETETVYSDDLKNAFDTDEEAEAAFSMFDKDMNGDISMEELEAVCVEIGRERKSITASLKDLDSVVAKLDDVFMFIVFIITILVFISLISTSAAGVLTSAGSTVLALSWLFSATAQEFLQSCIFVFVKHPFDVGDRVGIYGNTGALGRGDDYFVKEISLLYTEFKKMEGHVVQAPNSYLNTLFILNQRRSGGLAEAVSITIKFGTTLEQIDGLRTKLLDFVKAEKREYQGNILTELRDLVEVHSMNMNVVFFYKSNWQNEGLRLARRNKFICAMMVAMQELGIEGPNMRFAGQKQSFPVYLQNVPYAQVPGMGQSGQPDAPGGIYPGEQREEGLQNPPFVAAVPGREETTGSQAPHSSMRSGSVMKHARPRGESLSQMNKRVDFSLGASGMASGDYAGDVYADRDRSRIPIEIMEASESRSRERAAAQNPPRASNDLARSTSRDVPHFTPGNLARRSTDSGSRWGQRGGSVHRNRFFGRGSNLRSGTGDDVGLMENGIMADIPEYPSASDSAPQSLGEGRNNERLDPRSGMISPAAWRMNTNESNLHPPTPATPAASGALRDTTNVPEGHRPVGRSQTEDLEMRRFH
ncbi:hypothetical protein BAUCODRAFT_36865 [Baudoinia panamericana UAMH 10762]|uniref:EF-hand domain-containing protein n=1 Tax=Baudoinia panamericana (strain UAMH 10762) TaxID=717646 RepID=M2M9S7_BAUPA|nr:uncharacterized protein BAUCODRAFT_36865 [Baudoinia panamericana UAMH 10762]EMC93196.1 hypothetical protein BAUCODRAFT_36865 [Baudoinia panamericana UAMH 10762]